MIARLLRIVGWLLVFAPAVAFAHKPSDAYLFVTVGDARVDVRWDIALRDLDAAFVAAAATPFAASFTPLPLPVATITTPTSGGSYALGQSVPTSFGCADAVSCTDSNGASGGSGMLLTTGSGSDTYTVTATGPTGLTATATVSYTVKAGATKLTVPPASKRQTGVASATLTLAGTGAPVVGETVIFTTGKTTLCQATTGPSGVATCPYPTSDRLAVGLGGYKATFAGDANFQGSQS